MRPILSFHQEWRLPFQSVSKQIPIRLNFGEKLGRELAEGSAVVTAIHGLQELDCVHRSGQMILKISRKCVGHRGLPSGNTTPRNLDAFSLKGGN
jgi:hypothetical protein